MQLTFESCISHGDRWSIAPPYLGKRRFHYGPVRMYEKLNFTRMAKISLHSRSATASLLIKSNALMGGKTKLLLSWPKKEDTSLALVEGNRGLPGPVQINAALMGKVKDVCSGFPAAIQ